VQKLWSTPKFTIILNKKEIRKLSKWRLIINVLQNTNVISKKERKEANRMKHNGSWKILNRPKKLNAINSKVLLQFFSPLVCPWPHSYFLKTIGWYLGTFYTHNLSCYKYSKRHITWPMTCYIPLIPITCSKHAWHDGPKMCLGITR
jgi:hypothetical protein